MSTKAWLYGCLTSVNVCEKRSLIAVTQPSKSIVMVSSLVTQLDVITISWSRKMYISSETFSAGKFPGIRSPTLNGALHINIMLRLARNLPSSFFTNSDAKDVMLVCKFSI